MTFTWSTTVSSGGSILATQPNETRTNLDWLDDNICLNHHVTYFATDHPSYHGDDHGSYHGNDNLSEKIGEDNAYHDGYHITHKLTEFYPHNGIHNYLEDNPYHGGHWGTDYTYYHGTYHPGYDSAHHPTDDGSHHGSYHSGYHYIYYNVYG